MRRNERIRARGVSSTSLAAAEGEVYKPIKVTMNFAQCDIDNANYLMKVFRTRSKGAAVSIALGLTKRIAGFVEADGTIVVRTKRGELVELVILGLE